MMDLVRYYTGRARFRFAMIVATWAAGEIERSRAGLEGLVARQRSSSYAYRPALLGLPQVGISRTVGSGRAKFGEPEATLLALRLTANPPAAADDAPPTVVPLVPKRYAAGLEMRCPGGALYQTGDQQSQSPVNVQCMYHTDMTRPQIRNDLSSGGKGRS